jgi:hypothetical protein
MGQPADKDVIDAPETPEQPAGKVEHDARGKAVWRWAADVIESTSVLLKRLENRALALEPTQKVPVMGGADRAGKHPGRRSGKDQGPEDLSLQHPAAPRGKGRGTGGGFDPYNSR